jgi:hypothetical protein
MKLNQLAAALAASLLVSACGGGGDSAATGTPADPGPDTGNQPAASAKYVGSWTSPCGESEYSSVAAPGVPLKSTGTLTLTRATDTVLNLVLVESLYATADCSGSALQLPHAQTGNTLTIAGAATVGGKPVEKIIIRLAPINSGIISGGNITHNGVLLPGDYFTRSKLAKDIVYIEGNLMTMGDATEDTEGYPIALDPTYALTRTP